MSTSPVSNITATTAILTRNETFKKYPWAFFGFGKRHGDYYSQTLLIDNDKNKDQIFSKDNSVPAIVKKVYVEGSDANSGSIPFGNVFSEEEQYNLFCQAYESFSDVMNFTELINYFKDLNNKLGLGGKGRH